MEWVFPPPLCVSVRVIAERCPYLPCAHRYGQSEAEGFSLSNIIQDYVKYRSAQISISEARAAHFVTLY